MLLPFGSKPNPSLIDVVEKLHGDIYVLLMPNAGPELLLEAGARHERTLAAVSSMLLLGAVRHLHTMIPRIDTLKE